MANPIAFLCRFFILLPSFIYPVLSICYFILILEHFSAFHYPLKSSVNLSFFYHFIYLFIYLFQQEHSIFPVHSRKPGVGKHPFPRRLMFPAHLNQRNVYSAVKQIFAIRFMACGKANIHNPSLQLCWQGLASLLAHERSRFAICQWELSTPTDRSIPLIRRLVLRALEAGECLFAFKKGQSLTTGPHLVRQTLKSFDYPLISSTRPSTPYFVCFFLRWSKRIFAIHPCSSADRA